MNSEQRAHAERERFRKLTGQEPPPPPDPAHPLAGQWDYKGTKPEREELREELEQLDVPPVIEGQETLL